MVGADRLEVHVQPDEASFGVASLERGDRVRVRRWVAPGWAEIDPPQAAISFVARTALAIADGGNGRQEAGGSVSLTMGRARVQDGTMARAGHLGARMPGPAWVELPRGTMVRLVDQPPLRLGRPPGATDWLAIVPPAGARCYIRSEELDDEPHRDGVPEVLATYLVPQDDGQKGTGTAARALPPEAMAEITRLDRMHREILAGQPIERWALDPVRAGYQDLLKRWGDNPAVEETLRLRLARVTRHEQASKAAREFQEVMERSRRRDAQVALLEERLAAVDIKRTVTYQAIGLVQPSSRVINGHKLHVLIGPEGQTLAFLEIPPGLDVEAIGTRRVGVRGAAHYNQELGTRLITVRDVEPLGARR